jgi:hypothetical protein
MIILLYGIVMLILRSSEGDAMAACCTGKKSGSRQHRSEFITILERANLISACNIRPARSRRATQRYTFGHEVGNNSATVGALGNFAV